MIRHGLFILISIASFYKLKSQKFGGGLYIGMTTSQIDGDGLAGFDLPGFHMGAFTDLKLTYKSGFLMELAFIQKGSREPISDSSTFYKARLNYIELPLLYVYRLKKLSFELGPALDINVFAKEEDRSGERRTHPEFCRFNLTGIFGINWHFSRDWHINFRSNISITPIRSGFAGATGKPFFLQLGGRGQRNVVLSFALVYGLRSS